VWSAAAALQVDLVEEHDRRLVTHSSIATQPVRGSGVTTGSTVGSAQIGFALPRGGEAQIGFALPRGGEA
jgi:hypothetical protein